MNKCSYNYIISCKHEKWKAEAKKATHLSHEDKTISTNPIEGSVKSHVSFHPVNMEDRLEERQFDDLGLGTIIGTFIVSFILSLIGTFMVGFMYVQGGFQRN